MEPIKDSRSEILGALKGGKPSARPLPEIPIYEVPGDVIENFCNKLKGFDGEYVQFNTRDEAVEYLKDIASKQKDKTYTTLPEIEGCLTPEDYKSPAEMEDIEVCIAEAILGVGETGSLLVDTKTLGAPAAALFSTDLYLLIDRSKISGSLQEAYNKINLADYQYSSFFSGPSATADIEAVHITGAQGEISLTAVIY